MKLSCLLPLADKKAVIETPKAKFLVDRLAIEVETEKAAKAAGDLIKKDIRDEVAPLHLLHNKEATTYATTCLLKGSKVDVTISFTDKARGLVEGKTEDDVKRVIGEDIFDELFETVVGIKFDPKILDDAGLTDTKKRLLLKRLSAVATEFGLGKKAFTETSSLQTVKGYNEKRIEKLPIGKITQLDEMVTQIAPTVSVVAPAS